jgi:tetratricopeptide (TPR) repeat protein
MRFALIGTIAVALAQLAIAAPMLDGKAEYALAEQAEKQGDWDAALLHYENVYDSTPTTPEQRVELRRKFLELHPKVQPNTDPAKAGVFRMKVYVFRTVDVKRTVDGKEVRVTNTYPDSAIEEIRAVDESFRKQVWEHTLGNLRVEWDLTVVEEPLTKVDGWPDPGNCAPHFTGLEPGR